VVLATVVAVAVVVPVAARAGDGPGADGLRFACGLPSAELRAEADAVVVRRGLPVVPAELPARLLLVGDSGACTLSLGLRAVGEPLGMTITDTSMFGCGVAAGEVTSTVEETPARSAECPGIVRDRIARAAAGPTDVIVWMSAWERMDQVVDGRVVRFASPEGRRLVLEQMEGVYRLLRTYTAAPIVIVSDAAPGPGDYQDGERRGQRSEDHRYVRLADLQRRFAALHRTDVVFVDLARRVCPNGPPCDALPRFNPRQQDGVHLSTEGSVWAARWLVPKLARVPRR
jgi:hypothetical protein